MERHMPISTLTESTQELVQVSTRKRYLKRRYDRLTRLLAPILFGLTILFFILFVIFYIRYYNARQYEICESKDCIESAYTLHKVMDPTVDPCKDFYNYACGKFGDEHPLGEGSLYNSWFDEGEEKLNRMAQTVLESRDTLLNSSAYRKTKDLYASCLDKGTLEKLGLADLYELLQQLGLPKFPSEEDVNDFNLGKTMGLLQRYLNIDAIIEMAIDKIPAQNNTFLAQIAPSAQLSTNSLFGKTFTDNLPATLDKVNPQVSDTQIIKESTKIDMSAAGKQEDLVAHKIVLINAIMLKIKEDLDGEEVKNETQFVEDALRILQFTAGLSKISQDINETEEATYLTFAELQNTLEDFAPSQKLSNKIIFEDYVTAVFSGKKGPWTYVYNEDIVGVITLDSMKLLVTFLGTNDPLDILRYLWWLVVSEYAQFTTEEMETPYRNVYEAILGKQAILSRTKTCLAYVRKLLPFAIAKPVKNHFGLANDTSKVAEMLHDIIQEFEDLAFGVDWMDYHTKLRNVKKARAVQHFIGYESSVLDEDILDDAYKDLVISNSTFLKNMARLKEFEMENTIRILKQTNEDASGPLSAATNPLQVNAYYARNKNAVFVPAGILQKPFYYKGLQSMNYGAIGSILGHELTHGFDNEGKHFDHEGNEQEHFWSDQITQKYNDKTQCFVKQYNKFNISKKQSVDGEFTLAENIADNGGLRESFYAYQTYRTRSGPEPKLPGFVDFTHEQLFFLSFANVWCEASTERYHEVNTNDNHSPNRVRVLGILQNMKEFSEAFNCPTKTFMNPDHKCILW